MTTRILKYLILLACFLLIIAISSFWFGGSSFIDKDVALELEGPTQVSAGDEVIYKLKYANNTRTDLHDLELTFFYPEGSTVIVDGNAIEDHTESFNIDSLAAGEKGEKEFSNFLVGERGNIKTAKAVLSFKAGTIKSGFEKTASLSTTIVTSALSLTLAAPPSIVAGQIMEYTLDYRNGSEEDISDLIIEFDYPEGFVPSEFSPQPDKGNYSWQVQSLKKNSGGRITVKGKIGGSEGENKLVSVKLKRKIGNEYVDYQRTSATTLISNPIFQVSILVNNTSDYSASLGDRLSYTVKYKNNSNLNLSGVSLAVKLEGDMFDFSSLDTRGGFFDDASKTIIWNSSTVPEFTVFSPNAQGQVNFNIPIKISSPASVPGASKDKFVKVTAELSTPNVPTGVDAEEIATLASLVTKIGTQPTLNQFVYYNDPNFGSSGPIPMRVGEETFFTVHWQLTNPGNDTKNVKISAKLPVGISWVGLTKTTNGQPEPAFNPNSSEVIWNLGLLPYGAGVLSDKYETSFQIKIKPSSTQKGSTISLLENIHFSGEDTYTGQSIIINKNNTGSDSLVDRPREGTVQ